MEDEIQEKIKKEIISELIIDGLFQSLNKMNNGKIEVENYKIDEKNMTYLLKNMTLKNLKFMKKCY